MRKTLIAAAVVGIVASAASVGFTQSKPSATPSLEGVWKNTSVIGTGPDAGNIPNRPTNINIWTKKYFSRVTVDGPARSVLAPAKDPAKLSDAEKLARYEHWRQWNPVAGTYDIKGTQWFQTTLIGKSQTANILKGTTPAAVQDIKFEGKTLVLTGTSADGKTVTRRTYTRLDQPSAAKPHPIEGVWKGTSTVTTGANASSNPNRQANMFIYKNGYYTLMTTAGTAPRPVIAPPKDAAKLTDAEKIAAYDHWDPVGATAGRYEVKGTTLYQYSLVAKNQSADIIERNKTGNLGKIDPNSELVFSNGNNTMVQIAKSSDGKSETRRTYTRLE